MQKNTYKNNLSALNPCTSGAIPEVPEKGRENKGEKKMRAINNLILLESGYKPKTEYVDEVMKSVYGLSPANWIKAEEWVDSTGKVYAMKDALKRVEEEENKRRLQMTVKKIIRVKPSTTYFVYAQWGQEDILILTMDKVSLDVVKLTMNNLLSLRDKEYANWDSSKGPFESKIFPEHGGWGSLVITDASGTVLSKLVYPVWEDC